MLHVELHQEEKQLSLRLEGRLVGIFAEEVRDLAMRGDITRSVIVDVSEVTFVDAVGESVLCWLKRIGAEFVAESLYSQHICEHLRLPLANERDAWSLRKAAEKQASSHEFILRGLDETGSELAERGEQDARPRAPSQSESGAAEQTAEPHPARGITGEGL